MNHSPINQARLKKLLAPMLDIYRPSGKEEDLGRHLHGRLKRRGLPVRCRKVDEKRSSLEAAHRPEEWVSFNQAAAAELYYRPALAMIPSGQPGGVVG